MDEPILWHWTDGNGVLPFPGRRVEATTPGPFANMVTYEIREYLANEMVVSYRLIFPKEVPAANCWRVMEDKFRGYVEDEPHRYRGYPWEAING